ncbi:MAG: DoxX family protein [Gemmatimonadaceae bacterium]
MLPRLTATTDDIAPFLARVALGLVIFPHGAQKVLGWFGGAGYDGTVKYMGSMGMPVLVVILIMAAEFLGGLGLLAGLLGRVAAFGVACVMLGAILMVHMPNGFFMNWAGTQKGEGFEYHLLALGLALIVIVKGSGAHSVDRAMQTGGSGTAETTRARI